MISRLKWIFAAYGCSLKKSKQTVLTQFEVSFILGLNGGTLCRHLKGYTNLTGKVLLAKGNVQDIGPEITHKKKLWSITFKVCSLQRGAKRT